MCMHMHMSCTCAYDSLAGPCHTRAPMRAGTEHDAALRDVVEEVASIKGSGRAQAGVSDAHGTSAHGAGGHGSNAPACGARLSGSTIHSA